MQLAPDWLYRLIFEEVADLPVSAQALGPVFGSPPERLYIYHYAGFDWKQRQFQPPVLRAWSFEGTLPPTPVALIPTSDQSVRGVFFREGTVKFYVSDDGEQIVWEHDLGPVYALAQVFNVCGHGDTAVLEQDRPLWIP